MQYSSYSLCRQNSTEYWLASKTYIKIGTCTVVFFFYRYYTSERLTVCCFICINYSHNITMVETLSRTIQITDHSSQITIYCKRSADKARGDRAHFQQVNVPYGIIIVSMVIIIQNERQIWKYVLVVIFYSVVILSSAIPLWYSIFITRV